MICSNGRNSRFPFPRPAAYLCLSLHDERRRPVRVAQILGHSNIKMTERYAKLARQHIARTGNTAREMWKLLALEEGDEAHAV